ncbi:sensor histidine kinase [Nonomuraea rhizosphaerae]|uniref:sensor histidine kinase n=1 Tax=Nonomuraea rhizosphaerae TaxID=2665663 RepID=UPI001C5EEA86|nr:nitrate- and nitrite sensing domain-containing protein [Nonomuraea rhizosphaerae]
MRFRNSRLRTKIMALLLSLAALWAFAAWVTLREGVNLLWVSQLDNNVISPSEPLLVDLQRERRLSIIRLSDGSARSRKELETQRGQADKKLATFLESARAGVVDLAMDDEGDSRLADVFSRLDSLGATRQAVDSGRMNRVEATNAYAEIVDSIYRLYGSMATLDDKVVAKDIRTLLALSRAREVIAQEDALLAGALAEGRLTAAERAQFSQTVGAWRILAHQAAADLPRSEKDEYDKVASGASFNRLRDLENLVMQQDVGLESVPFTAAQWRSATERALTDFNTMILGGGDRVVDRAMPVAVGVVVRLVLAGGLGLLAVIASIVLSITTARSLLAQLQKLRDAAHELSDDRLPGIVERIGRGEDVDVAREAPSLEFGDDEIGQVGQAFNTVQRTAISVAAEQAELRRSIRDILLSLARRTQGLVHRQLTVLDVMERRETDPEELKELFRLDHLAIRMRRNAENLIVLSGSSPARTWKRSVPMVDVVRGALAEVEDYTRVTLLPMGDVVLLGRGVGDVIHLLAELIENAVSFSPPYTNVEVGGQLVANGYVVEIEDRGLGMKPEDLRAANERIADPPEFRITGTARLGLYVVSRLAERHGIQVVLKHSPYGGTTVVVLIPQELVQLDERPDPSDEPRALPRRTATATATAQRQRHKTAHATENVRKLQPRRAAEPVAITTETAADQATGRATGTTTRTDEAQEPPVEPATEFTPSGLPLRVPQANLAPALRDEAPATSPTPEEDDDERSPEEIRAMMGSLQSGNRLGRSEAAKLVGEEVSDDD